MASIKSLSLTLSILVGIPSLYAADTPPSQLDVVSSDDAGSEPDKIEVVAPNRRATELARSISSTNVITAPMVRERGYQPFVHEWLRGLPGVDVNVSGGGLGNGTQVRLRGAKAGETRFLVDGIPVTDATSTANQFGVELLSHGGVGQVEVVRGAQSGLYGSGAIGGVINVVTARPTADHRVDAHAEFGSFNTLSGSATATGPLSESFGYAVNLSSIDSAGFSTAARVGDDGDGSAYEDDAFYRAGGSMRLEGRHALGSIYLAGSLTASLAEYDDDYPPPTFTLDPNDDRAYQRYERWSLSGGGTAQIHDQIKLVADAAYTRSERHYPNEAFYTRDYVGDDIYAALQVNATLMSDFHATVGADSLWQAATLVDSTGTTTIDDEARLTGVWLSLSYDIPWLILDATVRHDDYSRGDGENTWRLGGATFGFDQRYKVFASVGSGFRAPTLAELYTPIYGNENLTPQTSLSADVGHTISILERTVMLTNTAFLTRYEDAITFDSVTFQNINLPSDARIYGIENALRYAHNSYDVGVTYTWQDSDDGTGARLAQLPDHKLMVDGTLRWHGAWVRVSVERIWSRSIGAQSLDPYTLVGAVLGYSLTSQWDVFVRGDNLTDADYEIYPGYATARRAYYGGVRANF